MARAALVQSGRADVLVVLEVSGKAEVDAVLVARDGVVYTGKVVDANASGVVSIVSTAFG